VGEPLGVGIVGCGFISGQYLATLATLPALRLVAVADQDPARAKAVAEQRAQRAGAGTLLGDRLCPGRILVGDRDQEIGRASCRERV